MQPLPIDDILTERFAGIDRLYGAGALARFAQCHVAVVGLGGVGSWLVEALARSGVGRLTLIDADDLCVSNTNRQLPALQGQYGRSKAEAMAERCRAINPRIAVDAVQSFLTPSNLEELLGRDHDLVIDACDSFRTKVEAIAWCRRRKRPILTVGAAGGRLDPTLVRVRDLSRTEHDAMLALIRKKLRGEFNCIRWRTCVTRRPTAASAVCARSSVPTPRSSSTAAPASAPRPISPALSPSPPRARRWTCC
jgi:tRNA A37 threonylcarbamoyladenosine dehydratase